MKGLGEIRLGSKIICLERILEDFCRTWKGSGEKGTLAERKFSNLMSLWSLSGEMSWEYKKRGT